MMPRHLMSRVLTVILVALATCWVGGFIWFLNITRRPVEPPPHTDGIVALTGGAGRVELALRLLASGQADRLLLSGIGGGTDLATLGHLAGVDTTRIADRITLGRYAASTRGNGVETAAWAEQNRIGSLIVVTAAFHMPRALAELHQALPDVRLFPLPVHPLPGGPGTEHGPGLRLEAEEFSKYLLAASGLSAWFPRREPVSVSVSWLPERGIQKRGRPGWGTQTRGIPGSVIRDVSISAMDVPAAGPRVLSVATRAGG